MQHILLLHGAIGSEEQLFPLRHELISANHHVHSFNFSGHGGKPVNGPFSIGLFAEELLSYIEANRLIRPAVFGYSMGGYVAMYAASLYPALFHKIATLGTKYKWSPETVAKEIKMLRPDVIAEKVPAFAKMLEKRHGIDRWKPLLQETADMLLQLGDEPKLNANNLQKITSDVLLLIGEKDNMVSQEETATVAQQVEKGAVLVLPDTHHPIEQVDVKLLAEKLLFFFEGLSV